MPDPAFRTAVAAGVLQFARPGVRWLSTAWGRARYDADAAYNITVPEGYDRTDLDAYVADRLACAAASTTDPSDWASEQSSAHGSGPSEGAPPSGVTAERNRDERVGSTPHGPALLTGVDQQHARGARSGSVTVVATVGLSNPTTLPMDPSGDPSAFSPAPPPGTVNLFVGTTRALDDGKLPSLLATAVEARVATLLSETGFTGTSSDAVVVGYDPEGERTSFAGSATELGADVRAGVRESVRASLASRYATTDPPESVADARYGGSTTRRAKVFEVD